MHSPVSGIISCIPLWKQIHIMYFDEIHHQEQQQQQKSKNKQTNKKPPTPTLLIYFFFPFFFFSFFFFSLLLNSHTFSFSDKALSIMDQVSLKLQSLKIRKYSRKYFKEIKENSGSHKETYLIYGGCVARAVSVSLSSTCWWMQKRSEVE